jgi:hypothetical protein
LPAALFPNRRICLQLGKRFHFPVALKPIRTARRIANWNNTSLHLKDSRIDFVVPGIHKATFLGVIPLRKFVNLFVEHLDTTAASVAVEHFGAATWNAFFNHKRCTSLPRLRCVNVLIAFFLARHQRPIELVDSERAGGSYFVLFANAEPA